MSYFESNEYDVEDIVDGFIVVDFDDDGDWYETMPDQADAWLADEMGVSE